MAVGGGEEKRAGSLIEMSNIKVLKDKIANLPDSAGVYIFKDSQGEIIYIGKAKSLRKRVSSYLGRDLSSKTLALMSNVSDMEYRLTPGESLALLLEARLVHQNKGCGFINHLSP